MLETSIKGTCFTFDCAYLLHCKYLKINLSHDGSYIDSPDWIKDHKSSNISCQ